MLHQETQNNNSTRKMCKQWCSYKEQNQMCEFPQFFLGLKENTNRNM